MTAPGDCDCHKCLSAQWTAEPLTGIEKAALQPLKDTYAHLDWRDQPYANEWVTVPQDDGGVRIRAKTAAEQLEELIAKCVGEVK